MTAVLLFFIAASIHILYLQGSSEVKMTSWSTFLFSGTTNNIDNCHNLLIVFGEYIQWLVCLERQVLYHLSSFPVLIGGPLPRGHEFELHDVRFHWGRENQRGSEHTVNFKAFPMEVRVHCIVKHL